MYIVVPRTDKSGRSYRGIGKTRAAVQFQNDALWLIRAAKPSRWAPPEGMMRMRLKLFLDRDLDSDNAIKALSDAVESALGIDDKRFLWCVVSKQIGVPKADVRLELEVCDNGEH